MLNRIMYQVVFWDVEMAMMARVDEAVDRAVYGAVDRVVFLGLNVWGIVHLAVADAALVAMDETENENPPHPALEPYMRNAA
jgi:hypothetical protein